MMTVADQIAEINAQHNYLVPVESIHRVIAEIHKGFGLDVQAVHIRIKSADTVNMTRSTCR